MFNNCGHSVRYIFEHILEKGKEHEKNYLMKTRIILW